MRKIISLIHLSLNGFTSGPNDELDWIAYDHELEQDAHSLHVLTDAVIWGRRTYEGMASYWLTVPGTPAELEHARFLDAADQGSHRRRNSCHQTAARQGYLVPRQSHAGAHVYGTGSD